MNGVKIECSEDSGSDRAFLFEDNETRESNITGFSIFNCGLSFKSSSPSITKMIINNSVAPMHLLSNYSLIEIYEESSPLFTDCLFQNNDQLPFALFSVSNSSSLTVRFIFIYLFYFIFF